MLRPINAIIRDNVGNIIHRGFVVAGEVAVDNGDGSYDVYIAGEAKAYPKIFTLARNPDLTVGDTVRILYKNGCKELPIILPPVKPTAIGDLIICDYETSKIWRCSRITATIIDTLTIPTYPCGATVANGNLITVGYVPSLDNNVYICVHNGFSSEITEYIDFPTGIYGSPSGLAFDGNDLISSDWYTKTIYIHDGISSNIKTSFLSPAHPYVRFPRGLTVINGDLINADANSDMIYVHNGITETVKNSFASPKPQPNGLTNDGNNLISGDNGTYGVEDDLIYIHSGITSTITKSFSAPAGCLRVNGLAFFK